ncbi:MAG: YihY/virulence factor BrkB family protein [Humibacillus sp.]|nr:YihY/virulence factor BrkB family protein [Humibacillus sp.]MDN5775765.1 YihY/virulence factor BrkB family protein [Humibacillus sp.]
MSLKSRGRAFLERIPGGMPVARLTLHTFNVCLDYRVTGLAAEAAFFMLLSLPPLVLGLFGAVGFVGSLLGPDTVDQVITHIRDYASQFLTESSIVDVLLPTIQDVLKTGRAELVSIGFLLSLWSGSRALNVFVDTISIMYGQKDVRGIVHMRALSLALYTLGMLVIIVLLPLVLIGPELIGEWLPDQLTFVTIVYWPFVVLLSISGLTTLYHIATPRRGSWWRDTPGSLLALAIWLLASVVVRMALEASLGGSTIYGPLSTPIVLLIWLYTLAIAILIGAGLNAATRIVWPVELHEGLSERIWARVRAVFVPSADSDADLAETEGEGVESRPIPAGPTLMDDPDTRQRARDQQFAKLERSALAEAIERELAHGLRRSKDDDER